jgi:competence protein ComEC
VITGEKGKQSTLVPEPVGTVKRGSVKDSASTIAAKETEGNEKTPGLGIVSGIICLLCMLLCRIKGKINRSKSLSCTVSLIKYGKRINSTFCQI